MSGGANTDASVSSASAVPGDIVREAGTRTPEVSFRFSAGELSLAGESYPEDVTKFYRPLIDALDAFVAARPERVTLDLALVYFNSSSAKALTMIMERVDRVAAQGARAHVHWFYDPEDETMQELGEEFGEDLEHASFELSEHPAS